MFIRSIDVFRRSRFRSIWAGGSIVLLVLLAYIPAVRAGFVWDDDAWTVKIVGLLPRFLGGWQYLDIEVFCLACSAGVFWIALLHTTFRGSTCLAGKSRERKRSPGLALSRLTMSPG